MEITYSADGNIAYFDGVRFRKDKKTGYFLAAKPTYLGKRERLHVYVWRFFNGPVPDGYHIHHKNGDKDQNDISNLECLVRHDHLSFHGMKRSLEHPEINQRALLMARDKARKWHGSAEGREWHRIHAIESAANMKERPFVCQYCGRQFMAKPLGSVKFCSNACKTRARYHSGVDNETRT